MLSEFCIRVSLFSRPKEASRCHQLHGRSFMLQGLGVSGLSSLTVDDINPAEPRIRNIP